MDRAHLAVLLAVIAGCGHPATREECEAIFERSAEIEIRAQDITDPAAVASRLEEVRKARGTALIDKCVGRRITEEAVACVKSANNSEELDACLQ